MGQTTNFKHNGEGEVVLLPFDLGYSRLGNRQNKERVLVCNRASDHAHPVHYRVQTIYLPGQF